jgi:hypothetical protein
MMLMALSEMVLKAFAMSKINNCLTFMMLISN